MITKMMAAVAVCAVMFASGAAFAHDAKVQPVAAMGSAGSLDSLPSKDMLPAGVVQVSPFVPGMGEHWADPKNLPFGPIYCVMDGRVTCMEYMISQDDFKAGKSFETLRPRFVGAAQPAIDHMEFNFEPQGHEGYEVPHYDVHMYFVSPETRTAQTQAAIGKQALKQ